jgi:hypothetical protein
MDKVGSQTNETIRELNSRLIDCVNKLELKFDLGELDSEDTIFLLGDTVSYSYNLWQTLDKATNLEFSDTIFEAIKWVFSTCKAALKHYADKDLSRYNYTMIDEVKARIDIYLREKDEFT